MTSRTEREIAAVAVEVKPSAPLETDGGRSEPYRRPLWQAIRNARKVGWASESKGPSDFFCRHVPRQSSESPVLGSQKSFLN